MIILYYYVLVMMIAAIEHTLREWAQFGGMALATERGVEKKRRSPSEPGNPSVSNDMSPPFPDRSTTLLTNLDVVNGAGFSL